MSSYTDMAFESIRAERARQDAKWGQQEHHPLVWIAIISEELGEAAQEALRTAEYSRAIDPTLLRAELVQIAASATAAIECLDRQAGT